MSYKRELLMAGVPELSTRAFVRNGRGIMPQSGGGGSSTPATTTQNVNSVPEFVRPYVESMLGKTQALTNDAQYQPYDPSQRFEGANPLQQQSYDAVGGMQVAPQIGQATGAANAAMQQAGQAGIDGTNLMNTALGMGSGAVGAGNQYAQNAQDPNAVGGYMSPYMQNVVDVQKQQAIRDYQTQVPGMNAAATQAGAFGGSRHAILQAEGQRNLNQNLSDIQAKGSQSAYDQAIQSMQFGTNSALQGYQTGLQGVGQGINAAQLGLQGANTQLQGAGTLGQLGQTQYNQQMGIAEAQNAMGTQQQQFGQQQRDFDYQQYLDELNFPYKQLGFMSDMTRGLPLSQSTSSVYNAQPNTTSQLIGAGLGAYGLANRAAGGKINKPVKKYAEGGAVSGDAFNAMDIDKTTATLETLSDEQLAAYAGQVRDAVTLSLIQNEMTRRESMRAPQGQMPQSTVQQDAAGQMPQQAPQAPQGGIAAMAPPAQQMAGGGIVGYAEGGRAEPISIREYFRRMGDSAAGLMSSGPTMPKTSAEIADPNRGKMNTVAADTLGGLINPGAIGSWALDQLPASMREGWAEGQRRAGAQIAGEAQTFPVAPQEYSEAVPPEFQSPAAGTVPPPNTQPAPEPAGIAALANPPQGQPAPAGQGAPGQPAAPTGQGGQPSAAPAAADPSIPDSFNGYIDQIRSMSGQDMEDAEATKAMRAGLDERQARALAMEKRGQMDALIAAGAAMMSGTSLKEGLAKGADAGTRALFAATEKQDRALEAVADAQDAQRRYELSLKREDRKEINDAYKNYTSLQLTAKKLQQDADNDKARLALGYAGIASQDRRGARADKMANEVNRMMAVDKLLNSNPAYKQAAEGAASLIPEVRAQAGVLKTQIERDAYKRYGLPYEESSVPSHTAGAGWGQARVK